ncbi:MAG: 50S ribosomal protein L24 [Legionellales bacterium]|nr:50S ribosomal protein L24 [Legionellales bacterium]OUX64320.1 MAG: 50S ribosomal protein L24 [Gammaproteobacteria bacterium TMED281]
MAFRKIRKNDKVKVITGKDKGKTGIVKSIDFPKCLVEGINLVSKCVKANPNINEAGGVRKIEAPIHVSNLTLIDETDAIIKVGAKVLKDGKKVRINKKTGKELTG